MTGRGGKGAVDAFLGVNLITGWYSRYALTFGNEPLNLEEGRRRRSKLHFRGGNRASFAERGASFCASIRPTYVRARETIAIYKSRSQNSWPQDPRIGKSGFRGQNTRIRVNVFEDSRNCIL